MTLEELYTAMLSEVPRLAEISYYDHIEIDEGQEIYPPIVFFHEVDGVPFMADNQVYWIGVEHRIDVYTSDRSGETRGQIASFLNSHDIPFTLTMDDFDQDTMLYIDRFDVTLDE